MECFPKKLIYIKTNPFQVFKGYLPQNLLSPFLNTSSDFILDHFWEKNIKPSIRIDRNTNNYILRDYCLSQF